MRGFLLLSMFILLMAVSFFSGQIFYLNKDLDSVYELVLKSEAFNEKVKLHIKETISNQRKVDHDKVENSFSKANTLLNEGFLPEANLYYSKTLYDSGWDIRYVDRYVDNMLNLDYCDFLDSNTQHQDEQYLTCLGLFTEIDAFLRSQAVHVSTDEIQDLMETLGKISEKHSYITDRFEEQQRKKQVNDTDKIIKKAKFFIENGTFEDYSQMLLVSENLSRLDVLAEDNLNRDLGNKIQDVLRDEEIKKIDHNAEILVSTWKENAENKLLQANYAGLANTLISNYLEILLASKKPLENADELIQKLNKPISKVQDKILSESVNGLKEEIDKLLITKGSIESDEVFFEVLTLKNKAENLFQHLTNDDHKKTLLISRNLLLKEIYGYNSYKSNTYNIWAIKELNELYNNSKINFDLITVNIKDKIDIKRRDKDALIKQLIEHFGIIDTGLLNVTVMNAYNELFHHLSSILNIDDKLEVLGAIAHKEKFDVNLGKLQ